MYLTEQSLIFFGLCDQNLFQRQIPMDLKIEVFSQGTDDSKNFRCETLDISDYEYVNISRLAVLDIKLWLEKDDKFNKQK